MYFCDKDGRVWRKEGEGFRSVGIEVEEEVVTFRKIKAIRVLPGEVVMPSFPNALPLSVREAVSRLGISEDNPLKPLQPLKNLKKRGGVNDVG